VATLGAFVAFVVAGPLHHHEIAATPSCACLPRGYTLQIACGLQKCNIPVRIW
jgi:hypothetical protein